MKERLAMVVMLFGLAPFLIAGASNPPVGSDVKLSGPMVNAVVVIIANTDSEPLADTASIWLQRGGLTAGAVFKIAKLWNKGCDLDQMDIRFLNRTLSNWIPSGDPAPTLENQNQGDVLGELFTKLGITISETNDPVLTDATNIVCTDNPGATPGTTKPGYLSFQAAVQFAH